MAMMMDVQLLHQAGRRAHHPDYAAYALDLVGGVAAALALQWPSGPTRSGPGHGPPGAPAGVAILASVDVTAAAAELAAVSDTDTWLREAAPSRHWPRWCTRRTVAAAFQLIVPLRWRSPLPTYICRGRAIFCSGSPALSCHWASQPGMRPIANSTGNMLTGKPIAW
jgi:hypothetical protein